MMNESSSQSEDVNKSQDDKSKVSTSQQEEPMPPPPKIFSTSRPKDALDGVGKGVGNILKGALSGAAMVVTAPVAGAYQGGQTGGALGAAKGFGIGLGMGVLGGTALIVGGAATGLYQVGRGIFNTPEALNAMSKGMEWDEYKKQWIVYKLQEEADEVLNMSDEDFLKANSQGDAASESTANVEETKVVKELEYYEVLGVPSNASSSDIKKAYYTKAKQNHPDRHPNDPEAHAKFQKIGEAYQVLSDEKLRANYDARGKEGVEDAPKMDSSALFTIIFGSEKFEPLVGELKVASYLQQASAQANGQVNEEPPLLQKFRQRKREVQCALNLVVKLQPYVDSDGDIEAYQALIIEEMKELTASPVASALLATIGSSYTEYAKSQMSTMDSFNISFQQASRGVQTRLNIASAGIGAAMKARELQRAQAKLVQSKSKETSSDPDPSHREKSQESNEEAENKRMEDILQGRGKGSAEEADFAKKVQEISGQMFSMMWHLTDLDIRTTLSKVCRRVINDRAADVRVRTLRLQALRILGDVYSQSGSSVEEGMKDLMTRLGMAPPSTQPSSAATASEPESKAATKESKESASPPKASSNSKASVAGYQDNVD